MQIARVLALNSRVVIFDEPTARLGARERDILFGIFSMLKGEGRKLIFVTHYLNEVLLLADRATVMLDGRVVSTIEVKDTSAKDISRLVVGDDLRLPSRSARHTDEKIAFAIDSIADGEKFKDVSLQICAGEIIGLPAILARGGMNSVDMSSNAEAK